MLQNIKRPLLHIMIVLLIFSAVLFVQPATAQAANPFTDINFHWARDAIVRWEAMGALQDFQAGRFFPDSPITRAEFFSILVRALGATEKADISRFTDVQPGDWYYDVVAMANQMRIANGTSETTMDPTANITRQDAATLVARAFGLSNEDTGYLDRYADSYYIADYAKGYVSAITEYGYMRGSFGNFNPRAPLSRAEAVKIIDNLFTYIYRPEVGFDNLTLNGNLLTTRSDSVFNGLTINGDLILGDGVGESNVTLNDCLINGRLVVRGGGPNSIVLNNTQVTNGVVVYAPSYQPRIVTTGSTTAPLLTAFSSFILSGTGVHSAKIAADAMPNSKATLSGVQLDNLEIGGLAASVDMSEGRIAIANFTNAAAQATLSLGAKATVDYISTVAPNTTVSGSGQVEDAFINAPGANFAIRPKTFTVGGNLVATIGGQTVSGQALSAGNTVVRNESTLAVTQDGGLTGGDGVVIDSAQGRSSNAVLVTQKPVSKIPLDRVDDRQGYFIGFFIPAPSGVNSNSIPTLTYGTSDGGLTVMRDVALTSKGGRTGLEFFIPVTRDGGQYRGRLSEDMYIQWNDRLSENLVFHSGWLDLEPLSDSQENRLVEEYRQSRFYGLDGERYDGAEALKRLLTSDNPLGLEVSGFAAFTDSDQQDLADRLVEYSSYFTSKQGVQERLNQILGIKGALYAINNAVTVDQVRNALENSAFAKELNIEISPASTYGTLSQLGKTRVARLLLNGRTKEYANAAAVKTAFDKAAADTKNIEVLLLVGLNAAKTPADVQRLIENKSNADLLGFDITLDPYKSYNSTVKLELARRLLDAAPFYSADDVAQIINDFLVTYDPGTTNPKEDETILSVTVTPTAVSLLLGESATFSYTITTPSGSFSDDWNAVTVTSSNANVADAQAGTISARTAGTARITITSVKDTKKSATIAVTVRVPVPATGITLNMYQLELEEGQTIATLRATMTPANTTDTITWSVSDPSIASVSAGSANTAIITGSIPGFAKVTARTSSNMTASADVVVVSKEPGVMVNPKTATVGIGQDTTIQAVVSPISIGAQNRRVRWVSADTAIATVDTYGKVTGVSEGVVEIRAYSLYYPDLYATCTVTVDSSIRKMTLNTSKIVMVPTGYEDLTATLVPPYNPAADVIKWDVRPATPGGPSTEIATVSATGRVTAVSPGTVYVYAYLENTDVMAECEVQVLDATLKVTFPTTITLNVGDKLVTAIPTFLPATVTNKKIDWTLSESDVVGLGVNPNGSLTLEGLQARQSPGIILTGKPQASPGLSIIARVIVNRIEVRTFTISPSHIYLYENDFGILTDPEDPRMVNVLIQPTNATDKTITWTADNSGRVSITNVAGDAANPFGSSSITANKTTFASEQVMGADGLPVYYPDPNNPGSTLPLMRDVDYPVSVTARASNGSMQTLLVTVYRSNSDQMKNVKIALDRWVYPVGTNQNLSLLFNVTGRDSSNGSWELGTQPPNRVVSWESDRPDIAWVDNSNMLHTLKPGIVTLTVTTQDRGFTDTVRIVVSRTNINSMTFAGLSTQTGFYRHLQMTVGESKDILASFLPAAAANVPVMWRPYQFSYASATDNPSDPANADPGPSGGFALDMVNIATSADPWNTATITALKPGLVRVEVMPTDDVGNVDLDTTAVMSVNQLQALCTQLGRAFNDYLAKNAIVQQGSVLYTWNELNINIPNLASPLTPIPLNLDQQLNLVIPNTVANNDFLIWVKSPPLQSASIINGPASLEPEGQITLTARVMPLGTAVDSVDWSYDVSKLALLDTSESTDSMGLVYNATFQVLADTAPCNSNITFTVNSKTEYGLKSTNWPRQVAPGDTKTATYSLTIVAPPEPPLEPAFAPVAPALGLLAPSQALVLDPSGLLVPADQLAAPEQPVVIAQPFIVAYGYHPAPEEIMLPVSLSKVLKVRAAATVVAGDALNLIPMLSPGNYDQAGLAWISSKPEIATVDGDGVVSSLKAGKTVITISVPGTKLKASCAVTVVAAAKIPLNGLTLAPTFLTLEAGKMVALKATLDPVTATLKGMSWISSNNAVATVDAVGRVTAHAAGSATITAITDNGGYKANCVVTVTPKPVPVTGVKLSNTTLIMAVGDRFTLTHTILPADATNQAVTWISSNTSVVTVENGQLTAIKKGSATITVITENGQKKAGCRVTVK